MQMSSMHRQMHCIDMSCYLLELAHLFLWTEQSGCWSSPNKFPKSSIDMQGELVVAGVFVRVYNEQPTFPVTDPPAFCKGLVSYLHVQTHSPLFRAAQTDMQRSSAEGKQEFRSARFIAF